MLKFKEWPHDRPRMDRYRLYQQLYDGEHEAAFEKRIAKPRDNAGGDGLTWLEMDYPKMIVNVSTNLLVSETPVISYEDETHNDALNKVMERCRFPATLLEVAKASATLGDAVLVARDSASAGGVVIEPKPAYAYFPELDPDNCREVLSEQLAWKREYDGKTVLRVDRYLPGEIQREAYWLDKGKVGARVTGYDLSQILGGGDEVVRTGLRDRNTIVHIPNDRDVDDFWGKSDLGGGLPSLFEEIDWRASQISIILDRHADPKLAGPPIRQPKGQTKVDLRHFNLIEVRKDEHFPQYLIWDAQLIQATEHYKRLESEILRHSETAAVLAGKIEGARFDSARAYRIQLAPTLAKNARKRTHLDPALKEIIRIAVAMELGMTYEEVPAPNVRWRDGLPKDTAEASQTENNRIASKTTSRVSAIRRLDDCDEQTALAELERIAAEQARFGSVEMLPQTPDEEPADPELSPDDEEEETEEE